MIDVGTLRTSVCRDAHVAYTFSGTSSKRVDAGSDNLCIDRDK